MNNHHRWVSFCWFSYQNFGQRLYKVGFRCLILISGVCRLADCLCNCKIYAFTRPPYAQNPELKTLFKRQDETVGGKPLYRSDDNSYMFWFNIFRQTWHMTGFSTNLSYFTKTGGNYECPGDGRFGNVVLQCISTEPAEATSVTCVRQPATLPSPTNGKQINSQGRRIRRIRIRETFLVYGYAISLIFRNTV